jgi:hypothetical protein
MDKQTTNGIFFLNIQKSLNNADKYRLFLAHIAIHNPPFVNFNPSLTIWPHTRQGPGPKSCGNNTIKVLKLDTNSTLKRLRNRYRLVVMNEDTYEEVVKFRLSRVSVYVALSTLFVLLVGLTVALIVFTPLKYYLPGVGYGDAKQVKEFKALKIRTDSLDNALRLNQRQLDDIKKVLTGKVPKLDTATLDLPKAATSDD